MAAPATMTPCPSLINTGSCVQLGCRFNHDVHVCEPCGVVSTSLQWHTAHLAGKRHRKTMKSGPPAPTFATDIRCPTCDTYVQQPHWQSHQRGELHRKKERYLAFQAVLSEASKDKHGVVVSDGDAGLDLGITAPGTSATGRLSVSTLLPYSRIALVEVKISTTTSSSYVQSFLQCGSNIRH
jgi:helicase MOV-10